MNNHQSINHSNRETSIKNKMIIMILTISSVGIFIVGSLWIIYEWHTTKQRLINDLTLLTNLIEINSKTAISYGDATYTKNILSSLKTHENIDVATIYDSEESIIASQLNNASATTKSFNDISRDTGFSSDYLSSYKEVKTADEVIGYIYIESNLSELNDSLKLNISALIFLLLIVLATIYTLSRKLQTNIINPVIDLANIAQKISRENNYSIRASKKDNDEIGILSDHFNNMLEQIQNHEEERNIVFNKLERSKENLNVILSKMVDSVITFDDKGTITLFNESSEKLFGFTKDEAVGININTLIPEYFRENVFFKDNNIINTKNIQTIDQIDVGKKKDKTIFPIRLSIAELPEDETRNRQFVGSFQDLTQLKQQEEQLNRAQKMDALGKLTGGVAHDYNNMLGIVMGYSDLLKSELNANPKLSKYAQEIHHAGERGSKLTQKLLSFSKNKPANEDLVNINALLNDEKSMLEKILTARISLKLDLEKDLWPSWLDYNDMEDVILNMSINAMHAINGNGELTFKTRNLHLDDIQAAELELDSGEYVLLSIIDNGCGIPLEVRNKIFDPFFTTKGENGTGLGLSQAYGFMKRSNGSINVDSEPGRGTHFDFYFPRYFDEKSKHAEGIETIENHTGSETILIVDDEASLLFLTSEHLNSQGYNTITASNASQALDILEQQAVDLILTDIIMPEMNGYELAAIIQEKYPAIKIQLVSGYTNSSNLDYINEELHQNLLYKPYESAQLFKRLRELLDT